MAALTSSPSSVDISGATIIGAEDDFISVHFKGGRVAGYTLVDTTVVLPIAGFKDLADLGTLPLAAPQISVGTVFGTQLTFRFLPSIAINDDLGELKYFGFGIQHNPGIWLANPLPVDVSASFFTQSIDIGTLFNATSTAFGVNASYELGFAALNLTPYAGFMFESSNMEVKYKYIVQTPAGPSEQDIKFELEGENKTRLTLGLSIRLLLININADYNIGKYNSISAGLTFRI